MLYIRGRKCLLMCRQSICAGATLAFEELCRVNEAVAISIAAIQLSHARMPVNCAASALRSSAPLSPG
eukprot:6177074-Pleurochrysis_carterae.AAC.2